MTAQEPCHGFFLMVNPPSTGGTQQVVDVRDRMRPRQSQVERTRQLARKRLACSNHFKAKREALSDSRCYPLLCGPSAQRIASHAIVSYLHEELPGDAYNTVILSMILQSMLHDGSHRPSIRISRAWCLHPDNLRALEINWSPAWSSLAGRRWHAKSTCFCTRPPCLAHLGMAPAPPASDNRLLVFPLFSTPWYSFPTAHNRQQRAVNPRGRRRTHRSSAPDRITLDNTRDFKRKELTLQSQRKVERSRAETQ